MLNKIIAVWAAIGVVLTGATQLRLPGTPVGPGEVVLALWMAFFGFCLLRGVRFQYSSAFRVFLAFWLLAALLMALGSLVALHINGLADDSAGHDLLSFIFISIFTVMLGIQLGEDDYYLTLARATFLAIGAAAFVLLVAMAVTSSIGPVSLWYYEQRFRGWSHNPNQLANFMLPMPFLGWYLLRRTRGLGRKLVYALGILVSAVVGVATESDALRVGWAGALAAIAAVVWYRTVVRGRGKFLYITHLLLPLVAIALAVGAGPEILDRAEEVARQLYEKEGQGSIRFTVWGHGIDALLLSPIVGLGPGAHAGHHQALEGMEAHNTFIDWGTSTGLLGTVLLVALLIWCIWRTLRAGELELLGVALVIIIDSLFAYSLRGPIYWILLVLVVALTDQRVRQTAAPSVTRVSLMRAQKETA